jgi:hypothetical protein
MVTARTKNRTNIKHPRLDLNQDPRTHSQCFPQERRYFAESGSLSQGTNMVVVFLFRWLKNPQLRAVCGSVCFGLFLIYLL